MHRTLFTWKRGPKEKKMKEGERGVGERKRLWLHNAA
jgi:hypothetical protein